VRIEGLQAKPEMNGRTGVVRGAFNAQSGRWTVEVAADEAGAACLGTFRPANLCVIEECASSAPPSPAVNVATEWLDELGCVCPKAVDYASQCPKGHALVPFAGGGCGAAAQRVMCRICHTHAAERAGGAVAGVQRGRVLRRIRRVRRLRPRAASSACRCGSR